MKLLEISRNNLMRVLVSDKALNDKVLNKNILLTLEGYVDNKENSIEIQELLKYDDWRVEGDYDCATATVPVIQLLVAHYNKPIYMTNNKKEYIVYDGINLLNQDKKYTDINKWIQKQGTLCVEIEKEDLY